MTKTLLGAVALAALGCGVTPAPAPLPHVSSSLARNTAPDVPPADAAALAQDNLAFALDLYPGVATDETENVFYSPYSVSLALAMTYAGAAGETAAQMATALHFSLPGPQLAAAFDALDLRLRGDATEGVTLDLADALWGDKTLHFQAPFLDTLAQNYGAGLTLADFINAPETARGAINGWVDGETEQMIPELLPKGSITSDTRLVLVNAVYFHASWETKFDPTKTTPATFTRLDGSTVQASEMVAPVLDCNRGSGSTYDAVELPYANGLTSMVVVLPRAGDYDAVEKALSGDFVAQVFAGLKASQVELDLPKFTVHAPTFSIKHQLEALGMTDAFAIGADFSAMLDPQPPKFGLLDVLQQAVIEVDEAGTKASAATAVLGGQIDSVVAGPPVIDVNRPFFLFIRDIPTNTVLFVGRVLDPTA